MTEKLEKLKKVVAVDKFNKKDLTDADKVYMAFYYLTYDGSWTNVLEVKAFLEKFKIKLSTNVNTINTCLYLIREKKIYLKKIIETESRLSDYSNKPIIHIRFIPNIVISFEDFFSILKGRKKREKKETLEKVLALADSSKEKKGDNIIDIVLSDSTDVISDIEKEPEEIEEEPEEIELFLEDPIDDEGKITSMTFLLDPNVATVLYLGEEKKTFEIVGDSSILCVVGFKIIENKKIMNSFSFELGKESGFVKIKNDSGVVSRLEITSDGAFFENTVF